MTLPKTTITTAVNASSSSRYQKNITTMNDSKKCVGNVYDALKGHHPKNAIVTHVTFSVKKKISAMIYMYIHMYCMLA